jgi:hypothetical protein
MGGVHVRGSMQQHAASMGAGCGVLWMCGGGASRGLACRKAWHGLPLLMHEDGHAVWMLWHVVVRWLCVACGVMGADDVLIFCCGPCLAMVGCMLLAMISVAQD